MATESEANDQVQQFMLDLTEIQRVWSYNVIRPYVNRYVAAFESFRNECAKAAERSSTAST